MHHLLTKTNHSATRCLHYTKPNHTSKFILRNYSSLRLTTSLSRRTLLHLSNCSSISKFTISNQHSSRRRSSKEFEKFFGSVAKSRSHLTTGDLNRISQLENQTRENMGAEGSKRGSRQFLKTKKYFLYTIL